MSERMDIDELFGKNFQTTLLGKIVGLTQASNQVSKNFSNIYLK
jgi:hypothetical protein